MVFNGLRTGVEKDSQWLFLVSKDPGKGVWSLNSTRLFSKQENKIKGIMAELLEGADNVESGLNGKQAKGCTRQRKKKLEKQSKSRQKGVKGQV